MLTSKQLAKNGGLHLVPGKTAPTGNRVIHQDRAALAAEINEHFRPSNPEERFLIDTIVTNRSRLRLLRSVEADLWNHADPAAPSFTKVLRTLGQLLTLIHSCQDNYFRALQALEPPKAPVASSGKRPRKPKSQPPAIAPNPPEAA
jgi:hypothetical protein